MTRTTYLLTSGGYAETVTSVIRLSISRKEGQDEDIVVSEIHCSKSVECVGNIKTIQSI